MLTRKRNKNKNKSENDTIKQRTRKFVRGYRFLSFTRNLSNKYRKQLSDTGMDVLKFASKKAIHEGAEMFKK